MGSSQSTNISLYLSFSLSLSLKRKKEKEKEKEKPLLHFIKLITIGQFLDKKNKGAQGKVLRWDWGSIGDQIVITWHLIKILKFELFKELEIREGGFKVKLGCNQNSDCNDIKINLIIN